MRTLFLSLLFLPLTTFAEDGPQPERRSEVLTQVKTWEKLDVNAGGQTRVYKFVDETELPNGRTIKTLCYVTDKTKEWADGAGIYCMRID